jgi:hypothetical protein
MSIRTHALLPSLLLAAAATAQVPDGAYVFGSFHGAYNSAAGLPGIFFAHPRDPSLPIVEVTGLSPALQPDPAGSQGAACIVRRPRDGALIVGERAPPGTSVDLHVLTLKGAAVVHSQLFSMGTSVRAGEIPQCALLPDGRVFVAATDLASGPLAVQQTAQYNMQGLGLVDTIGGAVTPLPIQNHNALPGVINALAISNDGTVGYVGNYISATLGDIWAVPLPNGGTLTQIATLPAGVSNLAVANDGSLIVTTLAAAPAPSVFRVDVVTGVATPLNATLGPTNCVAIETVTGSMAIASAGAGIPPRALFWMTDAGAATQLQQPNRATISCVAINPNPEAILPGTNGAETLTWRLAPNPGGLPEIGASFSLTLDATPATIGPGLAIVSLARLPAAVTILGADVHVDPALALGTLQLSPAASFQVSIPLPLNPTLRGVSLFTQTFHLQSGATSMSSSPLVETTIL